MISSDIAWLDNPEENLKGCPENQLVMVRWRIGSKHHRVETCMVSWKGGKLAFISVSTLSYIKTTNTQYAIINPAIRELRVELVPHEGLCYLVESESSAVPPGGDWRESAWRVELVAEAVVVNGELVMNGSCTCPDFDKVRHKEVARGVISRCKHIRRCIPIGYESLLMFYAECAGDVKAGKAKLQRV